MIPKIIHQIWFQGEKQIPDHLRVYHNGWYNMNPSFEVKLWDEIAIENILLKCDKSIIKLYRSYPYMIQKIDLAKYILLYFHGGIYIDMDMKPLKPISDSFLDYDIIISKIPFNILYNIVFSFIGHDINRDIINNGVIFSIPKHPSILNVIDLCLQNQHTILGSINRALYIYHTTGPICFTNAVRNLDTANPVVRILDHTYFESSDILDIYKGTYKPPVHAIGLHLYESSWISSTDRVILNAYFFICTYHLLLRFLLVTIIFLYLIF